MYWNEMEVQDIQYYLDSTFAYEWDKVDYNKSTSNNIYDRNDI